MIGLFIVIFVVMVVNRRDRNPSTISVKVLLLPKLRPFEQSNHNASANQHQSGDI